MKSKVFAPISVISFFLVSMFLIVGCGSSSPKSGASYVNPSAITTAEKGIPMKIATSDGQIDTVYVHPTTDASKIISAASTINNCGGFGPAPAPGSNGEESDFGQGCRGSSRTCICVHVIDGNN